MLLWLATCSLMLLFSWGFPKLMSLWTLAGCILWVVAPLFSLKVVAGFGRSALMPHLVAIRCNQSIPRVAWRGVRDIYMLLMFFFGLGAQKDNANLFTFLAILSFVMWVISVSKGCFPGACGAAQSNDSASSNSASVL